ncbi:hypothetical protein J1N35_010827 [Gossypium stocksii]|uniref:Uncharacterized protein n=1 Tax=Gossypium stocksii TaxID=47602 RepID=A0A9D3W162_9ROSI|nr:hypothetical protein J1N35_010827 [Gossypium stocksii]
MFFRALELSMGEEASSSKVMAVVPAENELIALARKFKRCMVSAVQDFPPGCGRVAGPNSGSCSGTRGSLVLHVIKCVYSITLYLLVG